ncbi:Octaprenyl diphosphate synthase / Dimethylallyltransferase / (2E,6E)-farnesyl diphosphate synthase / Geranylgeranyl pyrophosphate synthetase, partial [Olavius algarvensis spirochete endosymbiont]
STYAAKFSFNPRTREGCDGWRIQDLAKRTVSIHAPARGATSLTVLGFSRPLCFNPRTREGCDTGGIPNEQDTDKVSIHAPARGATTVTVYVDRINFVSIHAPARGATVTLGGFWK